MSRRRTVAWTALAVLTTVAAAQSAGAGYRAAAAGLPDSGSATTWLATLAVLAHTVLGIWVLGEAISVGFIQPTTHDTVTHDGMRRLRRLAPTALAWSATATAAGVLSLAVVLGLTARQVLEPGVIAHYALDLAVSRNYLVAGLLAAVVAVICALAVALNWVLLSVVLSVAVVGLPLLNSHAASLGDHSLAVTSSLVHGVAVTVWVGTLIGTVPALREGDRVTVMRYQRVATTCVAAVLASGVTAAYARMDSATDLVSSAYGRLTLVKVACFTIAIACAVVIRRRVALPPAAAVLTELGIMAIAVGAGVALHRTAPSRSSVALPSAAEDLLGFAFPPAPSWRSMVFGWHPDYLLLVALAVAAVLYGIGLRRSRGWPALRAVAFYSGLAIAVWASSGGIARYSMMSFSAHMVSHMSLSMLAPIFIVLGAPMTLALRSLPATSRDQSRSPRQWLAAVLHSGYATLLSNPIVVLALFTFGLYGMYFTSAFAALMSDHTGHTLMSVHFLLTGLVFSYVVIGVDPTPRPLAYPMRLIMVVVAMAIHAFFAIALMQSTVPIGNRWYSQVRPPWIDNPLLDTYSGGGVAWALGEVPSLLLLVAVAYQWSRHDSRLTSRLDRQADRDDDAQLRAYNARLAQLNQRDINP